MIISSTTPSSSAPQPPDSASHRSHPLPLPLPLPKLPGVDPTGPLSSPIKLLPSSRRSSSSFSSTSHSSASDTESFSIPIPTTPLRPSSSAASVPFSWEKIPGLPKTPIPNGINSTPQDFTISQLPLPPAAPSRNHHHHHKQGNREHRKTHVAGESSRRDPFLAALMECSKDDRDQDNVERRQRQQQRQLRSPTEKMGSRRSTTESRMSGLLVGYSCKRTCGVAESIVFVPRTRRVLYDVIEKPFAP